VDDFPERRDDRRERPHQEKNFPVREGEKINRGEKEGKE